MKNNSGSTVVEMCFIMPIVIIISFMAINMMILQINRSIALGETYSVIYTKESYYANSSDSASDTLAAAIDDALESELTWSSDISADVDADKTLTIYTLTATSSYSENTPGFFWIITNDGLSMSITAKEQVRDTATNLRGWQLIGEKL